MTTKLSREQRAENEKLAAKINAYWEQRGVIANARVEVRSVPVFFKYVTVQLANGVSVKRRVRIETPEVVRSYEIVSDVMLGPARPKEAA